MSEKEMNNNISKSVKLGDVKVNITVPENVSFIIDEYNNEIENDIKRKRLLNAFSTLGRFDVYSFDKFQGSDVLWALSELKRLMDMLSYKEVNNG